MIHHLGQIAVTVDDIDTAETFYESNLGLRKWFRYGDLAFFDLAGVRLLVEKAQITPFKPSSSCLYFKVADFELERAQLIGKGIQFIDEPHLIAPMGDHNLYLSFFNDPAGNMLALMMEAPLSWKPLAGN
ncbi:MAG: VOC family protein [Armatimonadota bacterium]